MYLYVNFSFHHVIKLTFLLRPPCNTYTIDGVNCLLAIELFIVASYHAITFSYLKLMCIIHMTAFEWVYGFRQYGAKKEHSV